MEKLLITPSGPLFGEVYTDGSKNAALPIIAATLLCGEKCTLSNVPDLSDVHNMLDIIKELGVKVTKEQGCSVVDASNVNCLSTTYEKSTKLRASFLTMGPLLARYGSAKIFLPGGCRIGSRPVDLHLKGFAALGADISVGHGYVLAEAKKLCGTKIYLDFPSVGATENIIMAATLAEGQTIIENCATEPEITALACFLNSMGAKIHGAGTDTVTIYGVPSLHGCSTSIIPDRIEAGTYMVAGAITGGCVTVKNVICTHLKPLTAKLREIGVNVSENTDSITVNARGGIDAADIKTMPYPGFPTDMQAQLCALMCLSRGTSVVTETVFENRFMHIDELKRMGASIKLEGRVAVITGCDALYGAEVSATDLRAGAALTLAGLAARGKTTVRGYSHIARGYANLPGKLNLLGADIKIFS